jgi:hypothetical protein
MKNFCGRILIRTKINGDNLDYNLEGLLSVEVLNSCLIEKGSKNCESFDNRNRFHSL